MSASKTGKRGTILVTGYGGWDNHAINPSQLLAESVTGHMVCASAFDVVVDTLPVEWEAGPDKLINLIAKHRQLSPAICRRFCADVWVCFDRLLVTAEPKAIVCLGLAGTHFSTFDPQSHRFSVFFCVFMGFIPDKMTKLGRGVHRHARRARRGQHVQRRGQR